MISEKFFEIPEGADIKITIDGKEFVFDKRHTLVVVEPRLNGQVVDRFYLDGLLPTIITGLDREVVSVGSGGTESKRINMADKMIQAWKK